MADTVFNINYWLFMINTDQMLLLFGFNAELLISFTTHFASGYANHEMHPLNCKTQYDKSTSVGRAILSFCAHVTYGSRLQGWIGTLSGALCQLLAVVIAKIFVTDT